MPISSFNQRFGIDQSILISDDFPETARIALAHLINEYVSRGCFSSKTTLYSDLLRTGRFVPDDFGFSINTPNLTILLEPLRRMKWWQVFVFIERIYEKHLEAAGFVDDGDNWVETESLQMVKEQFSKEINDILLEERLSYHFANGLFERRGHAQTQISFQRVGSILSNPLLSDVRDHYNKARKFFNERPKLDAENCVKEALCSLEACLEVITKRPASKEFEKVVRQLQGNDPGKIPPPIAESIIKLHAYRGSGQGVAHAALQGNRVTDIDAELVLSLVASFITYLVDLLLIPEEDVPF